MHRRAARLLLAALCAALVLPAAAAGHNFNSPTAAEGDPLVFDAGLELVGPFDPQSGTATEGVDFDGEPVPFAAGGIEVPTIEDDVDEPDETVLLDPPDEHGAGVGTITDDDPTPTLSIADVAVDEETAAATLTLTASNPSSRDIVVPLTALNGTAAAPADYTVPETATLPAGMRTVAVAIPIANDIEDEIDETFAVRLGAPNDATVGDGEAIVTIVNDDLRVVDVDDASTPEGDEGQSIARFTLRLNGPTFRTVTVRYATGDGLATAPADYLARLGTVTFSPGQTGAVVDVPVVPDNRKESPEAFALWVTEVTNARHGDGVAVGVIVDDDGGANPDTSDVMPPQITLGAPKVSGRRVTLRVACPGGERSCAGRITLFTVPDRRSRARSLRRERRIGARSFSLRGGSARNVAISLPASILRAARRAGRLKVQAFAVTQDAGGNVDTRTRRGTLRYRRR
jgi:Calx-beta domain